MEGASPFLVLQAQEHELVLGGGAEPAPVPGVAHLADHGPEVQPALALEDSRLQLAALLPVDPEAHFLHQVEAAPGPQPALEVGLVDVAVAVANGVAAETAPEARRAGLPCAEIVKGEPAVAEIAVADGSFVDGNELVGDVVSNTAQVVLEKEPSQARHPRAIIGQQDIGRIVATRPGDLIDVVAARGQ